MGRVSPITEVGQILSHGALKSTKSSELRDVDRVEDIERGNVVGFEERGRWTLEFSPRVSRKKGSSVDTLLLAQGDPYRTKPAEL